MVVVKILICSTFTSAKILKIQTQLGFICMATVHEFSMPTHELNCIL